MKNIIHNLHARLGDFWWYSLMLFFACRVADLLNAFVGLWLVPKFVNISDLGAIAPLSAYSTALSIPVGAFATAFLKEVNTLATQKKFGRMKSLMSGIFILTFVFLCISIAIVKITSPFLLSRIRICDGSLTILVLISSFTCCLAPIYTNALQALKRFKEISILNILGAPVRLLAFLAAVPFRAISGYFVGQAATPFFQIFGSIFFLRKELSVNAEKYWSWHTVRHLLSFTILVAISQIAMSFPGLVESTIIRQRLPDIDSAAFYVITRFSDIGCFVGATLLITLFPTISESSEKHQNTTSLTIKSMIASFASAAILAVMFACCGRFLLGCLPNGKDFVDYTPYMVCLTLATGCNVAASCYTNAEIAAKRFNFLYWWLPLHGIYTALFLGTTGYGYFRGILPENIIQIIEDFNPFRIKVALYFISAASVARLTASALAVSFSHRRYFLRLSRSTNRLSPR